MPTIISEANLVHEAQAYIVEKLSSEEYKNKATQAQKQLLMQYIDEACVRFNLGPKSAETMLRLFSTSESKS